MAVNIKNINVAIEIVTQDIGLEKSNPAFNKAVTCISILLDKVDEVQANHLKSLEQINQRLNRRLNTLFPNETKKLD